MTESILEGLEKTFPIEKYDANRFSPVRELEKVLEVLRDVVARHNPTELNLYISKGPSGNYLVDIRYKPGEPETQR